MVNPRLSEAKRQDTKLRVEQKLREGYRPRGATGNGPGAISAAAADAIREGEVNSRTSFDARVASLIGTEDEPDWTLYRPARYHQPPAVIAARTTLPPNPELAVPSGEAVQVLVIPDRHNDPRHEHRLAATTWISRFGSERRPAVVVDLGDAVTMDSCSRHDRNDTIKGRMKPPIRADLDNHAQSLMAFERGRDQDWKPKKLKVRGNHEQRLWAFENEHPESEGTHTHEYAQQLLQFGWRERDYGEFAYVDGVAFTHAPINGMGRAMGGKTATHRAGSMLTAPLVHGHTHALQIFNDAKMGPLERITVIQAGCAMPWGEIESYALHNPTGWWWGVLMLTVQGGEITDFEAVSMLRLRDRYSDDGG